LPFFILSNSITLSQLSLAPTIVKSIFTKCSTVPIAAIVPNLFATALKVIITIIMANFIIIINLLFLIFLSLYHFFLL